MRLLVLHNLVVEATLLLRSGIWKDRQLAASNDYSLVIKNERFINKPLFLSSEVTMSHVRIYKTNIGTIITDERNEFLPGTSFYYREGTSFQTPGLISPDQEAFYSREGDCMPVYLGKVGGHKVKVLGVRIVGEVEYKSAMERLRKLEEANRRAVQEIRNSYAPEYERLKQDYDAEIRSVEARYNIRRSLIEQESASRVADGVIPTPSLEDLLDN